MRDLPRALLISSEYNHCLMTIITSQIFEQRRVYDGSNPEDVQCQIGSANQARKCLVSKFLIKLCENRCLLRMGNLFLKSFFVTLCDL